MLSVFLSTVPAAAGSAYPKAAAITTEVDLNGHDMLKFGCIELKITPDEFLKTFSIGDIVTVESDGFAPADLPVCVTYDDVNPGERLLFVSKSQPYVIMQINYGSMALKTGLVEKDPTGLYTYRLAPWVPGHIEVRITMKEPGGFLPCLTVGRLSLSSDREAYPDLTDEEYANFRGITAGGILPGRLYRSTSPIYPGFNRNVQADEAARRAGIKTFINLTDSEDVATAFSGFPESYYATRRAFYMNLPMSIIFEEFRAGFCKIFDAIVSGEAPFLIHCDLGKDRCGLAAAVLEALCGASITDIREDFLKSFTNLYTIENGVHAPLTEKQKQVFCSRIIGNLSLFMDITLTEESNINAITEQFLLSVGVSEEKIAAVRAKLTE